MNRILKMLANRLHLRGESQNSDQTNMPVDWNDAEGWEHYYDALYLRGEYKAHRATGSIPEAALPEFAADLLRRGLKTAWIPGCGFSPLPKLLSQLGLDVYATDISPSAIAFQQSADNDVSSPGPESNPDSAGTLTCLVHDFRKPYLDEHFDLIINVKAIQGFNPEAMQLIASVHFRALKPGCEAYFDTMNVQGENRALLEDTLVEAGFVIPYHQLTRWYRQKLNETNIPHIFILGRPMIAMQGVYARNPKKRESDMTVLRAITTEYEQKAELEQEAEQKRITDTDRIATIIYSTG